MSHFPPGPGGLNRLEFARDPLYYFTKCARKYGDVSELSISTNPTYLLNHPDYIEYVLVLNHRNFVKHSFFWDHARPVFGEGLLTSEGEVWKRQRTLSQPAFHRDRIRSYAEVMVQYIGKLTDTWKEHEVRDLHQDFMRLTSQVVVRTLFGGDVENEEDDIGAAFDVMVEKSSVRLPFRVPQSGLHNDEERIYAEVFRKLDQKIYGIISRKRSTGTDGDDLLSMLMQATDEDGNGMTDRQLRDEVVAIFFAGHETSALALSWAWYLLSSHPEVESRLRNEADEVLKDRLPEASDLHRLKYTESVINESMRLYPPSYAIGRQAIESCQIGGFDVPAGTTIYMAQWVTHRDPRWYENPETFNPERWEGDFIHKIPHFAYFPFSGGPRLCIGNNFGMMEMVLMLSFLAKNFHIKIVRDHIVKPVTSITLQPSNGILAEVSRRQN